MRIISGTAKGHRLEAPKGMATRPTQDRVRESIFNILASRQVIYDAKVLDLFSGTGALALEALSRGAQEAVAVDQSTSKVIQKNAEHCKLMNHLEIIGRKLDVLGPLLQGRQFDLIFADPPYLKGWVNKTITMIVEANLLADTGMLIMERHEEESLDLPEGWEIVRELKTGYTRVDFIVTDKFERS